MDINELKNKWDFYDTHAHLTDENISSNLDELMTKLKDKKILVNNIGTDENDSLESINLAKKYPGQVFATIGFHPSLIKDYSGKQCADILEPMIKQNIDYIVAIGEFGLEYFDDTKNKEQQEDVFINLMQLARKYHLPCELHIRNAHEDAIKLLKQYKNDLTCVIHCFSSDINIVKQYLSLDCYIAVNGIITFNKENEELLKAIKIIPLNRILIETDCPYLTPVPFRGQINSPLNIEYIFNKLAEIYGMEPNKLKDQLLENSYKVFLKNK